MTLPSDISGLVAWWRADSVNLNGTNVVALLDKSGAGDPSRNAVQSKVAQRPTYNAIDPLYNNQPTVTFTGNQYLQTGTWSVPLTQPFTRILVCHVTSPSGGFANDSLGTAGQTYVIVAQNTVSVGDGTNLPALVIGVPLNPCFIAIGDNGASTTIAVNQITPITTGNAGTNGATGITLGDANDGSSNSLNGNFAEEFIYNRLLTQTELAQLAGYVQQRYGIVVTGSTQSAVLVGPYLSDLRLAAQQRADRVNASTISTAEWNAYVNASAQELYGALTSTNEDYNVKSYDVTLAGGSQAGNSFAVGPNTNVGDFFQPRALWLQISGAPVQTPYVPILRLESLMERHLYTMPAIVPVYGAIPSRWNLLGSTIEILPPTVAGNTYRLWYVPTLPTLVLDSDSIAQYWLSVNGWHEYIVLDVAAKALIKEESLDTAQLLLQQKQALRERILREAQPRDISQPQAIVDMSRVRNPWSGWGSGMPGPGWGGGDFGGGGNW